MTAISWQFGVNGSWNDATKWAPNVVPTASDDVTISAVGGYTVALGLTGFANSLTLNAANGTFSEGAASLTVTGDVALQAGTMILKGSNSFGSIHETGGVLQLYNAAALGSAQLTLTGGELSGMATKSIDNYLSMGGTAFTIDAATGTTVDFGNGQWFLAGGGSPAVQFGSSTRKGTVVWHTPDAIISAPGTYTVNIAGGTLKGGDKNFGFLFSFDAQTKIAAGATLDLNGFSVSSAGFLSGGGSIVNSGADAALILAGGANFTGAISGGIAVEIAGNSTFQGVNTYTGGTTIDSGKTLSLFNGGSIVGNVIDNGELYDGNVGGVMTLGVVSGTGIVAQVGTGTLVLNHADTYSGGTTATGGKISIGNAAALGTGALTLDNAELLATASLTLTNSVTLQDKVTIAAATGKTLAFQAFQNWNANTGTGLTVTFGDSANAGTVLYKGGSVQSIGLANPTHVNIAFGTLKDAGGLAFFIDHAADVNVAASAAYDLGGNSVILTNLTSAGLITSATVATLITSQTSSVSGTLTGKLALKVNDGVTTLTGADTYTGGTTINSGATLQLGDGGATGSIVGPVVDNGAFVIKESGPVTLNGAISGTGTFTQSGTGATTLNGGNTYSGGTTIESGTLIVTHGSALGTGSVTLNGAELISTASFGLAATQNAANTLTFNGANTIAAAHGTTLNFGGAFVQVNKGTLIFGEGGNDGTVVFKVNTGNDPGPFAMRVNAGTLKAGDIALGQLATSATSFTVAVGATLDIAGFNMPTPQLLGGGTVVNSGALAILESVAGTFSGAITGKITFYAGNVTLTGANTYTGGTLILGGSTLKLGAGGATGSIVGKIDDQGVLFVNETGAVSLAGVISNAGSVTQAGTGTTTLSGVNTYTGGTTIQKGVLVSAGSKALGVGGVVTLTSGGELLASVSQTLTHDLHTTGSVTFAAAHATTLNLVTVNDTLDAGKIFFGEGANDGTVVFKTSGGISVGDPTHTSIEVRAGTLKAGDTALGFLLTAINGTKIDAGAALDAGGQFLDINNLTGSGALENTGAANSLTLTGTTNFSGVISGKYSSFDIFGTATLSGNETFTGVAQIDGGTVTLSGLFGEQVRFNGGGTLVLSVPVRFTGEIQGFASGTTIDLKNISTGAGASLSYDTVSHVLTVSDGAHTDHLTFSDSFVLGNFVASSDGSGGTDISWQAPPPGGAAVAKPPVVHQFVSAMATFAPPPASTSHPPIHVQAASVAHLAAARM